MTEASELSCWKVILPFTKFGKTKVWGKGLGVNQEFWLFTVDSYLYLFRSFIIISTLPFISCVYGRPVLRMRWRKKLQAASFLGRWFFHGEWNFPLVLLYQLPLLSWFARWEGFLFTHTHGCPFHGTENVTWDFRDDIHHCVDSPGGSDGKVSVYNAGDLGSVPGSGRFPGEGNGNPL